MKKDNNQMNGLEQRTTLAPGLDVVSEKLAWAGSASIGIWIDAGSRDEDAHENGVAHFFEHMVFKGTQSRTALDIVFEVESKGGYLNAFTSRESTCFYARVIGEELETATAILCDMMVNPLFDLEDFNKEKEVVLEEIRAVEDNPEEMINELFCENLWGSKNIGRPIAGTLESVAALTLDDLKAWHQKVLSKFRIIVSAAGQVEHQDLLACIEKGLLPFVGYQEKGDLLEAPSLNSKVYNKKLQQVWYIAGTSVAGRNFRERIVWNLFNAIFGEGMASRLFQNIREKHGLVYSIYSGCDFYTDQSVISVSLCADPSKFAKVLPLLRDEFDLLLKSGISEKELDFAKQVVRGSLLLGLESVTSRMNRVARQVLYNLPPRTILEVIDSVCSITLDEVNAVVHQIFHRDNWTAVSYGPLKGRINISPFGETK